MANNAVVRVPTEAKNVEAANWRAIAAFMAEMRARFEPPPLPTTAAGLRSLAESQAPGGTGLQNVVEDLSPQFGNDMDARRKRLYDASSIDFSLNQPTPPHREGRVFYDQDNYIIAAMNDQRDAIQQLGRELWARSVNITGITIPDGKFVRVSGAFTGRPTVELAKADTVPTASGLIGAATHSIDTYLVDVRTGQGEITTFGLVRHQDTSGCSEGDPTYLSATVAGDWTTVMPAYPRLAIQLGYVMTVDATNGEIFVQVTGRIPDIFINDYNGIFLESLDFVVSATGGVITGTLQRSGGGNLTMVLSGKFPVLNCTPPATVIMTPGIDTLPQENYIYVPVGTKTLTASTTGWPAEEHVKVSLSYAWSAAATEVRGATVVRNHTDHVAGPLNMGHRQHGADWIRAQPATHISGMEATVAVSGSPSNVYLAITAGIVRQYHEHLAPLSDMATGGDVHIVNDPVSAWRTTTNLNTITTDSASVSLSSRYFSLVAMVIVNQTGQPSHVLINLPSGSYNTESGADTDISGFSNHAIPTGYEPFTSLVARINCRLQPSGGGTWTINSIDNITKGVAGAGGSGAGVTTFPGLADVPNYTTTGRHVVVVTEAETGVEFLPTLPLSEVSAIPPNPLEGDAILWQSDGSEIGDDGDIIAKITANSITRTAVIIDHDKAIPSTTYTVPDGYQAYWTGDNKTATQLLDESSNDFDLTVSGAWATEAGVYGDTTMLDGTIGGSGPNRLTFPSSVFTGYPWTFTTISMFMRYEEVAGEYGHFTLGTGSVWTSSRKRIYIETRSDTRVYIRWGQLNAPDPATGEVDYAIIPNTTGWVHILIKYDTTTGKIQTYLDGISQGWSTGTNDIVSPTGTTPEFMGAYATQDAHQSHHMGVDEILFYDRDLTPSEVAQLSIFPKAATLMFRLSDDSTPTLSGALAGNSHAVDNVAKLGINITAACPLHVSSEGDAVDPTLISTEEVVMSKTGGANGLAMIVASDGGGRGVMKGVRSRGTLTSPTIIANGDPTVSLLGAGYDGVIQRATAEIRMIVAGTVAGSQVPQKIEFRTGETTSRTTRMVVAPDGKVVINDLTPTAQLDVDGNFVVRALGSGSQGANPTVWYNTTTGELLYDTSSSRFKENIRDPEPGEFDWLFSIKIRKYKEKKTSGEHFGIIAEELKAVNPALVFHAPGKKTITVTDTDDKGKKYTYQKEVKDPDNMHIEGVGYYQLIAPLIHTAQQQQKKIDDLEKRLSVLEAKR